MYLTDILIFAGLSLFIRLILVNYGRQWLVFILSILAVFWLQPITPLRNFDFWFPVCTLALVVFIWGSVTPREQLKSTQNMIALGAIVLLVLFIAATRYIAFEGLLTRTRPPQIQQVVIFILLFSMISALAVKLSKPWLIRCALLIILLIFICLKVPWMAEFISQTFRNLMNQSAAQAASSDLRWLGYSYLAFRLLHVLRDCQRGRCITVSLREFVNYALFFPSLTAGPIDRLERFDKDLQQPLDRSAEDIAEGSRRLVSGLFKKFVLADTLSLVALNPVNAGQVHGGWEWLTLYAFSFQIYLDFSGYTDIAIGIGRFLGIRLPENFNRPYLQQSLTTFWNNWHMTLTNWFRSYFFNPLTRSLRKAGKLPQSAILFLTQLGTMILIGLWHGVTWNFLIWGAWHAIGLFLQNRWSDRMRPVLSRLEEKPGMKRFLSAVNIGLTFHYVTLGWIWFALPDPQQSSLFLLRLFGLA